ncbi:MAG: DUF2752 domain-containing protein [Desulfosudaceae bacterium]
MTAAEAADRPLIRRPLLFSAWRPASYWDVVGPHLPLALVAGLPLLLAAMVPLDRLPLVACTLLEWTGRPCPLCGLTRSFWAMAGGDWGFAVFNYPLAAPFYLAVAAVFAWNAAALLTGMRLARGRLLVPGRFRRTVYVTAALLLAANWGYRLALGLQ